MHSWSRIVQRSHRSLLTTAFLRSIRSVISLRSGGLLSYGNDLYDNFRRAATYADRILKGATPNELPVQAPMKFELIINIKTAKALGLTIPPLLLQRADKVIK